MTTKHYVNPNEPWRGFEADTILPEDESCWAEDMIAAQSEEAADCIGHVIGPAMPEDSEGLI